MKTKYSILSSVVLLLAISLFFGQVQVNEYQAQEDFVDINSIPQFQINQNLCPANDYCGQMWRLSPSGNRLFVYFTANYQLYTVDSNNLITQYDLSAYQGVGAALFDFVPYSEDSILLYDGYHYKLAKFDLTAQTISDYLPSHTFLPCNGDRTPPVRSFVRSPASHWLVVCVSGSSSRNISVIDLSTDTIYEIDTFSWSNTTPANVQPWHRVYIGSDGTIYAHLVPFVLQAIFPDYVTDPTTYTIVRRSPNDTVWSRIDIPVSQISAINPQTYLGRLINVDSEGNMYFHHYITSMTGSQYTKINPQGELVWLLSPDMLGGDLFLIDINTNGELVMVDAPNDTTNGAVVNRYDINRHPASVKN